MKYIKNVKLHGSNGKRIRPYHGRFISNFSALAFVSKPIPLIVYGTIKLLQWWPKISTYICWTSRFEAAKQKREEMLGIPVIDSILWHLPILVSTNKAIEILSEKHSTSVSVIFTISKYGKQVGGVVESFCPEGQNLGDISSLLKPQKCGKWV